ncbi:hypothetical protein [Paraclostridium bifermentans]|uniref:hypothetical protein n=1 Tax=Paraclostridium bifermentans TaxID=1490 RepID=UPI00374F3E32
MWEGKQIITREDLENTNKVPKVETVKVQEKFVNSKGEILVREIDGENKLNLDIPTIEIKTKLDEITNKSEDKIDSESGISFLKGKQDTKVNLNLKPIQELTKKHMEEMSTEFISSDTISLALDSVEESTMKIYELSNKSKIEDKELKGFKKWFKPYIFRDENNKIVKCKLSYSLVVAMLVELIIFFSCLPLGMFIGMIKVLPILLVTGDTLAKQTARLI